MGTSGNIHLLDNGTVRKSAHAVGSQYTIKDAAASRADLQHEARLYKAVGPRPQILRMLGAGEDFLTLE
jgi:hypothetical protein